MSKPIQLRYAYDNDVFTGEICLQYTEGVIYPDHTQTAAITLSVGPNPEVGGSAMIYIIANGDAITVPSDWVKISGNAINTTAGYTNILTVIYMGVGKIHYANTAVAP